MSAPDEPEPEREDSSAPERSVPREGRDYYVNADGHWVFRASYHMRQGECCGNKCRNCPFGWRNVPEPAKRIGERQPPLDGWE